MNNAASNLFTGIFVLGLSIVLWRLTGSFIGWMVLFIPGASYIILGLYKVLHNSF